MNTIRIVNTTNVFNKEIFIYAITDFSFKAPISINKLGYITLFFILWTLPIYFIFSPPLSIVTFIVLLVPPFILGHFANKPIWDGRSLPDFLNVLFSFIMSPKCYADHQPVPTKDEREICMDVWVSRRDDYRKVKGKK